SHVLDSSAVKLDSAGIVRDIDQDPAILAAINGRPITVGATHDNPGSPFGHGNNPRGIVTILPACGLSGRRITGLDSAQSDSSLPHPRHSGIGATGDIDRVARSTRTPVDSGGAGPGFGPAGAVSPTSSAFH